MQSSVCVVKVACCIGFLVTALSALEIVVPSGGLILNETSGLHPCRRTCHLNEPPKICYYLFEIEYYYTLSVACFGCPLNGTDCSRPDCVAADGMRRGLVTVNRQMPGPPVEVCHKDEIVVDLVNHLGSASTSIHWHGFHQRGTPYMDGVPHLTQCPQSPGSVFRYRFTAREAGTYFWHSHSGFQRSDGAYGALTVRRPLESDPHRSQYDTDLSEHQVLLTDWIKELAVERFVSHHHSLGTNKPETILINGRGRPAGQHRNQSHTPLTEYNVQKGKKHRFRLVSNGVMNCPLEVSVDGHNLTIIASDGADLQPVTTESLVIYAGERYDVVLVADQPKDVYWLKVRGLLDCDERFSKAHQVAVIRYESVEKQVPDQEITYETTARTGKQISPFNDAEESELKVPVSALRSLSDKEDPTSVEQVDAKFYLDYDFNRVDNLHFHDHQHYSIYAVPDHFVKYTPQFNDISLKLPTSPPLSQPEVPIDTCNRTTVHNCTTQFCECTHVLNVPLNAIVELLIIDRGFTYDANHPMHLHGHYFRVVGMHRVGSNVTRDEVIRRDLAGEISRNLVNAPIKDTVTVPDGGYTIVRFQADNPGWWLFHCHLNFHAEIGMALIFHVGDQSDVPPVPAGFPRCDNFIPGDKQTTLKLTSSAGKPFGIPGALTALYLFLSSMLTVEYRIV